MEATVLFFIEINQHLTLTSQSYFLFHLSEVGNVSKLWQLKAYSQRPEESNTSKMQPRRAAIVIFIIHKLKTGFSVAQVVLSVPELI